MTSTEELLKAINTNLELIDIYQQDLTFDEFIDELTESIYQTEIIYYSKAIEYLSENDNSLCESTEAYIEMGGTLENLNSEALATALCQKKALEELSDIYSEIEEAFNH